MFFHSLLITTSRSILTDTQTVLDEQIIESDSWTPHLSLNDKDL